MSISASIDKARLGCMIRNACRTARREFHKDQLWSFVSKLTGFGSTTSKLLCEELGIQPCVPVGEACFKAGSHDIDPAGKTGANSANAPDARAIQ